MAHDISLSGSKVAITLPTGKVRKFNSPESYGFDQADNLVLYFRSGEKIVLPYTGLTISTASPASQTAALASLDTLFLSAGGSALTTDSGAKTYTGDTWDGTAPSSTASKTYRWVKTGKTIRLQIDITYATAGATNTTATLAWPSDVPFPADIAGYTGNGAFPYAGFGNIHASPTANPSATRVAVRRNTSSSYDIIAIGASVAARGVHATIIFDVA